MNNMNKCHRDDKLFGSRKYPYLPHGRFFCLNPPSPLEFPIKLHTFPYKFWPLRPPSPLEFPMTFHGVGMDIFWNHTLEKRLGGILLHASYEFYILLLFLTCGYAKRRNKLLRGLRYANLSLTKVLMFP